MNDEQYKQILAEIRATADTPPQNVATCGACGFSWDDSKSTSLTPAPGARCPNEHNHQAEDGIVNQIVISTWDDAPRPVTGRITSHVDEEWVRVAWGAEQDKPDPRTHMEPLDELSPVRSDTRSWAQRRTGARRQ
jgi:hypothetical protein